LLGEGFLKLADGEVVNAARAVQAARAAAVVPAPPAPQVPAIYSAEDRSVVAPMDIDRRLPSWTPATAIARTTEHHGLLEVVINEQGRVESAILRTSVETSYDRDLLAATKSWTFKPATRDGVAVKYRKGFDIVLTPR